MWVVWVMTVVEVFFTHHLRGGHSKLDLFSKSMVRVGIFP